MLQDRGIRPVNNTRTRTDSDTDGRPLPSNQPIPIPVVVEYYPRGESSDYTFALLFGIVGRLLSKFFLLPYLPHSVTQNQHHVFFHCHLTFFVMYIWSKQHPDRNVNLFGVHMTAAYLPYAYLIMGYALNNGNTLPVDMLHGMFVGHLYYYFACVVSKVMRGRVIIVTPLWMVDLCNWMEGRGGLRIGGGGWDDNNPMLVDLDGVIGGGET
jgi:Derlin-2/3